MKLSIIIPAYNEEKFLPGCIAHIRKAFDLLPKTDESVSYEIIVTDNHSTDHTADVAKQSGASVVYEPINQISRARNRGADIARGQWLLFVDADSFLHSETLADLLSHLDDVKIAGGGCLIGFDYHPWWMLGSVHIWNLYASLTCSCAGSFVFCRQDVFKNINGFSTELFAAEEIDFARKLKQYARQNRMVVKILKKYPHVSSGRKFNQSGLKAICKLFWSALIHGKAVLKNRNNLDMWYKREK